MKIRVPCPNCQSPIESEELDTSKDILCTSCGSSFRLETPSTMTWSPLTQTVGRFQLKQQVGQGAFGTVYMARDPQLDRTVAIKIPRSSNVGDKPADLDRFLREARSVAQLRHASIVSVHEVGTMEGTPYLVCDFIEGLTLADVLSARRPTFRDAAQLVAGVADALHYAHEHKIVHRDIKPSNIMIREDGSPVVMDFGMAKREGAEITMTSDGQILGTPAYMCPEQARGESHKVDGRSDIYSLGAVLYQLITGELPFRGTSRMLLHQVLHDEPRPPRRLNDRIPRDLETICLKAMAKEPSRRYANAREFGDDLRRYLAGEPIHARPVGTFERMRRWCWRKPALTASLATVALLLIALVTGAFWSAFVFRNLADRERQSRKTAESSRKRAKDITLAVARQLIDSLNMEHLARASETNTVRKTNAATTAEAPSSPSKAVLPLPPPYADFEGQIEEARQKKNEDKEFSLLLKASNDLLDEGYYTHAKAVTDRMIELAPNKESRIPIAYGQAGLTYSRLGQIQASLKSHGEAQKYYRNYYSRLADMQANPKTSKAKREQLEDFLSHMARMSGMTSMRIGNVYKQSENFEKAETAYQEALELLERHARKKELVTLWLNIGALQNAQKKLQPAMESLQKGLALAQELGIREDEVALLVNLGNAQARTHSNGAALTSYQKAYDVLAQINPLPTDDKKRILLVNWIDTLIAEERWDDARKLLADLRQIVRPDQGEQWRFALRLLEACLVPDAPVLSEEP